MDERNWHGEWLRGVLSLCVLAVVAEGETYGYAIAQRLHEGGVGTVKGDPGRKTFTATVLGVEQLAARRTDWTTFTERATSLMNTGSNR